MAQLTQPNGSIEPSTCMGEQKYTIARLKVLHSLYDSTKFFSRPLYTEPVNLISCLFYRKNFYEACESFSTL